MSFDVATTKTGAFRSCSQASSRPNTRLERPASASPPGLYERPFSSSSIISTQGAICSAIRSALSRFVSVSPTYLS